VTQTAEFPIELISSYAFALVLILARVGAALALLPGLGEASIPAVMKSGALLCLVMLLLPIITPEAFQPPANEASLGLMVLAELANGLWFGWLARVIVTSLPLAGQVIADFAGLSNILMPSPELGPQSSAIGRLFEVAVPTLILSTGLYEELLSALADSYRVFPAGTLFGVADSVALAATVIAESFYLSLRLATPFLVLSVAWHLATGLIARLVPKLQIFFVAMPGQIWLSLSLLALLCGAIFRAWTEAMKTEFLALLGGG
jgi:flagellar biosynthetic protein FliR